jgi:hypothetical protein
MIGKQIKYTGFYKCLAYVLGKPDAEILDSNLLGKQADELARQFRFCCQKNPRVKRVLYQAILSMPADFPLENETWTQIAQEYLTQMGFVECPYLVVKHSERPHHHLHLLAGRVRADGSCVSDSYDYYRSEQILRSLEQRYQLPSPPSRTQKFSDYQPNAQEALCYNTIKSTIERLCTDNLSLIQLLEQLHARQIFVFFHKTQRTGRIRGITYELDGQTFTGTQLGELYTWQGLIKKRGLVFNPQQALVWLEESAKLRQIPQNPVSSMDTTPHFSNNTYPQPSQG